MSERNPWTQLTSKTVYSNPWITVREDQVICPDGSRGIYGVVSTRIATGVVAMTENNEVVLVGQYRYPTESYSWEIVEGGAEPDEAPLLAIKRELQEEAGMTAENWEQLGGVVHLSNCFSSEIGYLYYATGLTEVPAKPDHTEVLQVRKVPLSHCIDMVMSGEITDAITIIGVLRAERMINGRK